MRFSCDTCHSRYRIDDDKVRGRTLRVRCRNCGSTIVLQELEDESQFDDFAETAKFVASKPSGNVLPPAKPAEPQAPKKTIEPARDWLLPPSDPRPVRARPPPEKAGWFVLIGQEEVGPLRVEELRRLARQGDIRPKTYVWRDGMSGWERLGAVDDLREILDLLVPSEPAPRPRSATSAAGARPPKQEAPPPAADPQPSEVADRTAESVPAPLTEQRPVPSAELPISEPEAETATAAGAQSGQHAATVSDEVSEKTQPAPDLAAALTSIPPAAAAARSAGRLDLAAITPGPNPEGASPSAGLGAPDLLKSLEASLESERSPVQPVPIDLEQREARAPSRSETAGAVAAAPPPLQMIPAPEAVSVRSRPSRAVPRAEPRVPVARTFREHTQNTAMLVRAAISGRRYNAQFAAVLAVIIAGLGFKIRSELKAVVPAPVSSVPRRVPPPPPRPRVHDEPAVEAVSHPQAKRHGPAQHAPEITPEQIAAFDAVQGDLASRRPSLTAPPQLGPDDIDLNRTESPSGSVDPHVLKKKIVEIRPGIDLCVNSAVRRNPTTQLGKLNVTFTVGTSGIVTRVGFDRSGFSDSDLGKCLERTLKTILMPAFDGEPQEVEFSLNISGGGE
jgi:predicted Zn finger-like uncharacterized protein